ncbi:galactokinase [Zalaria obscura]|uniref:Galactokinase n=1 Tax=Zalaria obscura TaxID=2024903 RepID=A0ACC3S2Q9_9PEZI
MDTHVPVTSSLSDIYPSDALPVQQQRWTNLLSSFKSHYGKPAEYVSRSPGRVNIIGEHIDYSLYEVIPMAVTADVLIAVAVTKGSGENKVRIANVNEEKFPTREFEMAADGEVDIDAASHEWTNYFKSGLHGATELLRKKSNGKIGSISMSILVDGTIPSGGGLSSSAAFVCASALAVMKAYGTSSVDKKELVELAIVSERSVGVNSGGMDQSASVFSLRGSALYVSFLPELSARAISFPKTHTPLTFVIAQSFVAADKHVTAPVCYNLRVVECTLAALVLAKACRAGALPTDSSPLGASLRGFQDAFFASKDNGAGMGTDGADLDSRAAQLSKLVTMVEDYLPQEEGYTRSQISEILGVDIAELEKKYMTKFPVRAERFKLRQRALHVFSEAARVLEFMDKLESEAPEDEKESQALLQSLGDLLNKTQDSCRDVYECSCPELDEICQLARGAGAYGSRLTGAGWGGCSVHLVPQDKVEAVKKAWVEKYYKKHFPDITEEKLDEAIVVSKPGSGSSLFLVEGRESV